MNYMKLCKTLLFAVICQSSSLSFSLPITGENSWETIRNNYKEPLTQQFIDLVRAQAEIEKNAMNLEALRYIKATFPAEWFPVNLFEDLNKTKTQLLAKKIANKVIAAKDYITAYPGKVTAAASMIILTAGAFKYRKGLFSSFPKRKAVTETCKKGMKWFYDNVVPAGRAKVAELTNKVANDLTNRVTTELAKKITSGLNFEIFDHYSTHLA